MFAKFSPDDNRVAYVSGHNVYVENIASGNVTALTVDGSEDMINGTFDWAYEEEFSCRDGFRWSPDGRYISYWQVDASKIRDFLMINNTDSIYPYTIPVQYPKVGEDPSRARIGVVSADGGKTTWIPIPGDQIQNYIPRMMWTPDSEQIFIQQIPRKQNTIKIWAYTVVSGNIKNIYTDTDDAWIDVVDDWIWLNNGKEFSWVSEKDGWNHFYRISRDGSKETLVTKGDYDVVNIAEIDDENGYVYFIASPDNPTQRYLYKTKLDGKGKPERLTPNSYPGTNNYQISEGGNYAIHTHSDANTPPTISIVSLPDHELIKTVVENKSLRETWTKLDKQNIEFFEVTTEDGITMQGNITRPPDFDESKKYPVLFYVYGEPAGQTARDAWGGNRTLWHTMLAQQGYLVITMDNRGSPSPKGREWRKSLFRKIGVLNIRDQAMGAKEVLKWDFVDPDRVAVWGWSGGGSSTLNLLFQYPEIYKAGMSVAPVANQLMYDNIYQERYMGVPWETKEDFIAGSPVTHAKNLQGDLLLVHGTGDDNVHYQNSEQMINELIKFNKVFQLMSYPNRSHGIWEGQNTTRHVYTTLTSFLNEHVEPGAKERMKINTK
jgi:dipeptidyl-peptidase-4